MSLVDTSLMPLRFFTVDVSWTYAMFWTLRSRLDRQLNTRATNVVFLASSSDLSPRPPCWLAV